MKRLTVLFLFCALPLPGQSNSGELRLKVTDPSGHGVKAAVHIQSEANQYRTTLQTGDQGNLAVQRLPYGVYQLQIEQPGFATISEPVVIRSSLPTEYSIQLKLATVNELVTVDATSTLIDPDQVGSVMQIGSEQIEHALDRG